MRHITKKSFFLHKIRDIRNRNVSRILDQGKKKIKLFEDFCYWFVWRKGSEKILWRSYKYTYTTIWILFMAVLHVFPILLTLFMCGFGESMEEENFYLFDKVVPFFLSLSSRLQNIMKYIFVQVKGYKMYI